MLRLSAIVVSLFALLAAAHAQQSKTNMQLEIGINLPDNTTQLITPAALRATLSDMVRSYQQASIVRQQAAASDTLTAADFGNLVKYTNTGAVAVSIAAPSSGLTNFNVFLDSASAAGTVVITPTASTINGSASLTLQAGQTAWVVSDGVNYQAAVFAGPFTASMIPAGSVTNTMLANMASQTFKCNSASSAGAPQDCNYSIFNVKNPAYGALGNGTGNDATAINAAITAAINAGGGIVYFPSTGGLCYRITSGLVVNLSSFTTLFQNRIWLVGDGPGASCIQSVGLTVPALQYLGNISALNIISEFRVNGLRFTGDKTSTGIGVQVNAAAYASFESMVINGFDTGFQGIDMDQSAFINCNIIFNNQGLLGSPFINVTDPNSWSFYNTAISNNTNWGLQISHANAFNFNGGSIQYNGTISGNTAQWGAKFIDAGVCCGSNSAYGTVSFNNMAFEGNGGAGDFVSSQNNAVGNYSFNNVAFERTASFVTATVTGAANNGSGAIRLAVNNTANLTSTLIYVQNVGGVTNANSAIPWSYTIIDPTHVDLVGSTFAGIYTSGGSVYTVGFGTNNIQLTGSTQAIYSLRSISFHSAGTYVSDPSRPVISDGNLLAMVYRDGTNFYQNSNEAPANSVNTCGTTPAVTGSELDGTVQYGTGTPTSCKVVFAIPYPNGSVPRCIPTVRQPVSGTVYGYSMTNTTLTLSQTPGAASTVVDFHCSNTVYQ